ncbi:MAG: GlmU family protein [Phycisphaerales bacterium]|nr:GlmU family protein [Phycisphaerales bacterium]
MNYTLFDSSLRLQLLPFTHTRPMADIRCGIMTMRERWEMLLGHRTGTLCPEYMQPAYPQGIGGDTIYINAAVFGTKQLATAIEQLNENEKLEHQGLLLAARFTNDALDFENFEDQTTGLQSIGFPDSIVLLQHIWDIFMLNEQILQSDFALLTAGKTSAPLPPHVTAMTTENIFIEEGAIINPCIINASKGLVYIAANAEIMEGCMLRGPIALGKNAVLKMGAKVYGATTIGEGCKVGGEVSNSIFFANSNKGHDGFIGNAVIGEWCNLGADTNCSNLKNNYDTVKIWDEAQGKLISTGLQFCGLMMGDHSKCGINTMFNTGTVVGVSANIFGTHFPDKFIRSFTWGGTGSSELYAFDKAMETAARMMGRKKIVLTKEQIALFQYIFAQNQ